MCKPGKAIWQSIYLSELVFKFTNLYSKNSSTERDVNTHLAKVWTAVDRLSIMWKPDLSDKRKRDFFQAVVVSLLLHGCTTKTLTKLMEKKVRWKLHENAVYCWTNPGSNTPLKKTPTIQLHTCHLTLNVVQKSSNYDIISASGFWTCRMQALSFCIMHTRLSHETAEGFLFCFVVFLSRKYP